MPAVNVDEYIDLLLLGCDDADYSVRCLAYEALSEIDVPEDYNQSVIDMVEAAPDWPQWECCDFIPLYRNLAGKNVPLSKIRGWLQSSTSDNMCMAALFACKGREGKEEDGIMLEAIFNWMGESERIKRKIKSIRGVTREMCEVAWECFHGRKLHPSIIDRLLKNAGLHKPDDDSRYKLCCNVISTVALLAACTNNDVPQYETIIEGFARTVGNDFEGWPSVSTAIFVQNIIRHTLAQTLKERTTPSDVFMSWVAERRKLCGERRIIDPPDPIAVGCYNGMIYNWDTIIMAASHSVLMDTALVEEIILESDFTNRQMNCMGLPQEIVKDIPFATVKKWLQGKTEFPHAATAGRNTDRLLYWAGVCAMCGREVPEDVARACIKHDHWYSDFMSCYYYGHKEFPVFPDSVLREIAVDESLSTDDRTRFFEAHAKYTSYDLIENWFEDKNTKIWLAALTSLKKKASNGEAIPLSLIEAMLASKHKKVQNAAKDLLDADKSFRRMLDSLSETKVPFRVIDWALKKNDLDFELECLAIEACKSYFVSIDLLETAYLSPKQEMRVSAMIACMGWKDKVDP